MDSVEIALNTIYISLLIAATCAAFVASRNLASSTLAISTAALVGAAVVFALQTYFELQPGSDIDHVGTDFTLDASAPFIRQWTYPNYSSRPSVEISASNWLKVNNPGAFSNRDKLFSDFTIFSFIAFMMTTEFDWQLRKWVYPGGSLGTSTTVQPISKPEECKIYLLETLREKLKLAGNVFADAPITAVAPNRLCLPPDTNLKITSRSITFENYFYRATWTLDQGFTVMSHTRPGTGDMPILTSGIPQYETRVSGLTADVIYFRFRAKSPTMPKCKAWINRIITDSHDWFERKQ